jgi:hypothetical protein
MMLLLARLVRLLDNIALQSLRVLRRKHQQRYMKHKLSLGVSGPTPQY